jgi:hypothetical protein
MWTDEAPGQCPNRMGNDDPRRGFGSLSHCLLYVAAASQRPKANNVIVFVRGWAGIIE